MDTMKTGNLSKSLINDYLSAILKVLLRKDDYLKSLAAHINEDDWREKSFVVLAGMIYSMDNISNSKKNEIFNFFSKIESEYYVGQTVEMFSYLQELEPETDEDYAIAMGFWVLFGSIKTDFDKAKLIKSAIATTDSLRALSQLLINR